ncbi:glycoside hydrolase family 2 protein [Seonamhaeicola maritimus]|uniref:Glycoside hydrolase family 2 n=1 Tax=Seonamhaeicola maritimus TaxID=2591822 RepID=A0A5C7GG88_9FLAO|nr:glycoside hydrolase family 2 TIM barrel-domain containing protein [Seonamhaeicola maritimus]TXG36097.1 glycoside hydrolase family 2 [Seonamhaeicola maritimus]
MKLTQYIVFAFLVLSACTDTSINQYSKEMFLNGSWQFLASNEIDDKAVLKEDFNKWDTLQVPGNWDTRKRYSEYVGKGYYQKQFEIPRNWKDKQVRLKFDAVYESAKVWLNGEFLGEHVGGYTPFEFNITDKVDFKKPNSVVVMADNSYKRGAWWAWGGISRNVSLIANNDIRFVYQHITSEPDFEKNEVNFTVKYKLENNDESKALVKINTNIEGVHTDSLSIQVEANSTSVSYLKFKKNLSEVKLWHFNTPNLYELNSSISINDSEIDSASDKFGIRKFEARGEQFFLNNEAVRMNGVNRVHDHPDYGNTEPDHLVRKDMFDIKYNLGCNFSRLMHAPLPKNLLKLCDSIGFLVVEEIPVWGDDDPQSFPNNPQTKLWLKEMIERDYNHPSVVAWSVGNELRNQGNDWKTKALTKEQYGYVNSMLDYVDELDTTRLKTYVTITSYRKGEIGTEPYEKVDFISMNSYGKAPELAKKTNEKFPNKPIFVSEIGIGQIGPAPKAVLSDELVGYLQELKDLPYITGVSIWSYNDYRSNYKGTPESGFREWGIIDERRNKKEAYIQLKEIYKEWED